MARSPKSSRPARSSAHQQRIEEQEASLAFIVRVLAAILGLLILAGLAVQYFVTHQKPDFMIAAIGLACTGPVVAQSFATIVAAVRGTTPRGEE